MATTNLNIFIRRLARGMKAETLGDQSDAQLVERFLATREEAAFEALLRRHGLMVYRVCWRVLQQEHDVEDTFQATFLLLAQKLQSVRKQTSLGSWLHGVAHRVALKARARAAARGRHERRAVESRAMPADETTWRELRVILDAELTQLPDRWRLPLILCYLESRTQDEAARQLGWSKNTLRRRLEEARQALGRRLARSGVELAAPAAVLLSDCASPAALPPNLIPALVESAASLATGQAASAVVSAGVAALMEGVAAATLLPGGHITLALLLAGGVVAATVFSASSPVADAPEARATCGMLMPPTEPCVESKTSLKVDTLVGNWWMKLPAGFQRQVIMRPLGGNRVSVENAVRFSGIYEFRQGRLILVEAVNAAPNGFAWEVRNGEELALVAQPPVAKTGANYLGATLRRLPHEGQSMRQQQIGAVVGKVRPTLAGGRPVREEEREQVAPEAGKGPALEGEIIPDEAKAVRALERIKADYRLKKEPAYAGPVQYCLLLLGRKAQTRVCLASDGKTLYVDKNGDGDLTQPDEAIPFKPDKNGAFASFIAESFPGHGGEGPHTRLHIAVRQHDWEKNTGGYWAVRATVDGRYPMYAFAHKFAHKLQQAPVIHLGGPLRLRLYDMESGRLVRGQGTELNATVGCSYPGVERAFVDVDHWDRRDLHPVAEIRLPASTPGADPITLRVPLTKRC